MSCETNERGQRFEADGELQLLGAHIAGQLRLIGAHLANSEGRAGQLSLIATHLANAQGCALSADALRVDQDVLCETDDHGQRFEADGELRLLGAHIGGHLSLIGAHLANAEGPALSADGARVEQALVCGTDAHGQDFEADGELRLMDAHIAGQFSLADAHLSNPSGLALDFERGRAGRLVLPSLPSDAEVDLSHAVISELHDHLPPPGRGELGYRARLTGLTYDSLGPVADGCRARLEWVARATDGYVPQAYDQLATVLRRAGRDDDAKKVMIAKQISRRDTLRPLGRAASYTFGATLGYGYRTWRAAAALIAIVVVGWAVFSLAYPQHMTATRPTTERPDFHALLYSVDAVLPVVNLGQESAWSPRGAAQAWYGFSILAGWLLGLGLVAFLTARFFRE
jgi:hypothetical protein